MWSFLLLEALISFFPMSKNSVCRHLDNCLLGLTFSTQGWTAQFVYPWRNQSSTSYSTGFALCTQYQHSFCPPLLCHVPQPIDKIFYFFLQIFLPGHFCQFQLSIIVFIKHLQLKRLNYSLMRSLFLKNQKEKSLTKSTGLPYLGNMLTMSPLPMKSLSLFKCLDFRRSFNDMYFTISYSSTAFTSAFTFCFDQAGSQILALSSAIRVHF